MDNKNVNLRLENNSGVLELGKSKEFNLVSIEGLESADYEINISNNIMYDGGNVINKRIQCHSISFVGEVFINEDFNIKRQKLISFFNPKNTGYLTVNYLGTERKIKYEIESFKINHPNVYEPMEFQVNLVCANPYFQDVLTLGKEISTWIGGWKFKFKLPFRFKQKGDTKVIISNLGHVETPVEIIFKGPAVNPSIVNLTTGEFIKIDRTLTSDDILYITTEYGNKKVEIENNGLRSNALNYIDLDSTFFSLVVGDNIIEYKTDGLKPESVEIKYRNRYLGV